MEHLDARRLQRSEEGREIGGGIGEYLIHNGPELFFLRGAPAVPQPLPVVPERALAGELGVLDDGQLMLDAHPVREPPQGPPGAEEVPVFPGAVQGDGVVIDVIMDVMAVCVGGDEKAWLPFVQRRAVS